jgi:AcrR family transcriptional regulator
MARSRSTHAHEQVLESALKLFSERGIDTTSMDAIAAASGVSKATIYKHWADKDALCLEVLDRLHGNHELPTSQSNDVRADVVSLLAHGQTEQRSEVRRRMMPHLMAYAARNPAFGIAWRIRVMEPPREALIKLLKRAVAEGKLLPDIDMELSVALLSGPMMYRHVLSLINSNTPEDMPERVVAAFWKAYGVQSPRQTTPSGKDTRPPSPRA